MTRAADFDPAALVAALARDNADFSATPPARRRVALVLGPGDEAAAGALALLQALKDAGYRVEEPPASAGELAARAAAPGETVMLNDYAAYYAGLPRELRAKVETAWGAPERDPCYRAGTLDCGRFELRAFRLGNIAVTAPDDPGGPPPHRRLALASWLADGFRAQVVVPLGGGTDPRP